MQKANQIYDGKAKTLLKTDDAQILIQDFKNSATAFNGEKKAEFDRKGETNNKISTFFFRMLEDGGVKTHFLDRPEPTQMKIRRLNMIPLEFVVRNVVAGSLHKRTGLDEGTPLAEPIVETYYKVDALGDPIFADVHIQMMGLLSEKRLEETKRLALRVNDILRPVFEDAGLVLVDFKLEFGINEDDEVVLGDEISPDTCRIWDEKTGRKLDKDVFRRDLGDLMEAYDEVARRLGI